MGTNCAPLVADLFLFCYERDFMLSLSEDNQSDVIEAFNSTCRYLDDLLNIDNNFFDSMVNRIYPSELQLNKANVSYTEASFLVLHLSISDDFVQTKIYDKRDDFDFDIVKFPFLDGDVPRSTSYGLYISQLIRFARVSSHVDDFNTRNKVLTAKLLRGGRVVQWCWLNFQRQGVLLIWTRVGQGPTALAVVAGGGCLDILLSSIISLFSLPLSGRRPDID